MRGNMAASAVKGLPSLYRTTQDRHLFALISRPTILCTGGRSQRSCTNQWNLERHLVRYRTSRLPRGNRRGGSGPRHPTRPSNAHPRVKSFRLIFANCGSSGCGTVFELSPPSTAGEPWTETTLHEFNGSDGAKPLSSLIPGTGGSLLGATAGGGMFDDGTVFRIVP